MPTAAVMGGGALLGGAIGAFGKSGNATQTSSIDLNAPNPFQSQLQGGTRMPTQQEIDQFARNYSGPQGALGTTYMDAVGKYSQTPIDSGPGALSTGYSDLQSLLGAGPGAADVTNSMNASKSLSSLLQQYSQSGGLPSASDISSANGVASNMFAPQQAALNNSFYQQNIQAQRLSAQLGRPINDPIIQAKLGIGQAQQQSVLSGQQGAFGQQLALSLPQQRVGYATQNAGLLGGLASQAFQNRSALLGMGSQLLGQAQGYQIATSPHNTTAQQQVGGGLGGALSGALSGLGMGAGLSSLGLFGSGAGGLGGGIGSGLGGGVGGGFMGGGMGGGIGSGVGSFSGM